MIKENIPAQLAELERWVERTSYKHGGVGWNTPSNWHDLDSIGGDAMLVTTDTDILVVDADHVVNGNGEWLPEAREDYERIRKAGGKTFEERSVSDHGRHLVYDCAEYPDEPLSPIRIRYPEYENWDGGGKVPQLEIWYAAKHCFRITGKITEDSADKVMGGEGAANALRTAKQIVEERSGDDSGATGMTDAEIERLKRNSEPIPDGSGHAYEVARIAELVTSAGDVLTDEQIADTVYREMQSRFQGELKETFYDNAVKDAARFRKKIRAGRKDREFCAYSVKAWEAENGKTFSDAGNPWKAAFVAGLKAQEEGVTFDKVERYDPNNLDLYGGTSDNAQPAAPTGSADLPDVLTFSLDAVPELKPELLHGILREGHKMLIAGPSKAGKSFFLIELALAVVTGTEWIGIECEKRAVLYVNLEIDSASFLNRVASICRKRCFSGSDISDRLRIWNLRGKAKPLEELISDINDRAKGCGLVIVDPIYKVLAGDENSAADMAAFTGCLDRIAEGGAAIAFAHHFSKAAQSQYKDAASRASGSGVFARDPDAIISMSSLDMDAVTNDIREAAGVMPEASAYQLDFTLREFAAKKAVKLWFSDCQHMLDNGALDGVVTAGRAPTKAEKTARIIAVLALAFDEYKSEIESDGGISLRFLDGRVDSADGRSKKVGQKTIRDYAQKSKGEFYAQNGKLYRLQQLDLHNLHV